MQADVNYQKQNHHQHLMITDSVMIFRKCMTIRCRITYEIDNAIYNVTKSVRRFLLCHTPIRITDRQTFVRDINNICRSIVKYVSSQNYLNNHLKQQSSEKNVKVGQIRCCTVELVWVNLHSQNPTFALYLQDVLNMDKHKNHIGFDRVGSNLSYKLFSDI